MVEQLLLFPALPTLFHNHVVGLRKGSSFQNEACTRTHCQGQVPVLAGEEAVNEACKEAVNKEVVWGMREL